MDAKDRRQRLSCNQKPREVLFGCKTNRTGVSSPHAGDAEKNARWSCTTLQLQGLRQMHKRRRESEDQSVTLPNDEGESEYPLMGAETFRGGGENLWTP